MMLSCRAIKKVESSQIALLYDSNEFQTKLREKIEEECLETEMEKYLQKSSFKESDSHLADDDEIQINDVMIGIESASLTLVKHETIKTPAGDSAIQIEDNSLVNGTKKVDSMRQPNEPTDSKLNKEMINDSSTPQVKTQSNEKTKTEPLVPKKDPGKVDNSKKASCACCAIF